MNSNGLRQLVCLLLIVSTVESSSMWAQNSTPGPVGSNQSIPQSVSQTQGTGVIAEQSATTEDRKKSPNAVPASRNRKDADSEPGMPSISRAATPESGSEFQAFVAHSLGFSLPVFGYELFAGVPTTFAPVDRIPVTPDYVIGPGDEILIRAWGQMDIDATAVVDRAGNIYLPKIGNVQVAGLQFQQLHEYLKSSIGRVFKNFDLNVTLGQLHSVQVFVVGQAARPGAYTVSSLSTLINALFASGGPSRAGSMRRIQLKRSNRVVTEFDIYDLLLQGDKSKDWRLLPGDIIFIPPVGPQVAVAGSVTVPAIYELKSETTLAQTLEMAAGLTNVADGQKVRVERIFHHLTRRMDEFPLNEAGLARKVENGDLINVAPLSPRFENAVTLRGNVSEPGRYPWHKGMRVRDLIPSRDALITREYWTRQNAATGNRELKNTPEINWEYAVIRRIGERDLSAGLVAFNLGKAINDENSPDNVELNAGDILTVYSQADLAVPVEKRTKFVRLEGEFKSPGVYRVEGGETLRQLVSRAGGVTSDAYFYGAEFLRDSVRERQQKGLDDLTEDLELQVARNAAAPAGLTSEETTERRAELDSQRQLVSKLRSVKVTGRMVLELKPTADDIRELPDFTLEDGDRFLVPHRPSTVDVFGAVNNKNSFLFRTDRSVGDYLKRAGGATRNADKSRMFLVRADGTVLSRESANGIWGNGLDSMRLMPGDAIVVPERLSRGTAMRSLKDWTQIISQFALGAAAIALLQRN